MIASWDKREWAGRQLNLVRGAEGPRVRTELRAIGVEFGLSNFWNLISIENIGHPSWVLTCALTAASDLAALIDHWDIIYPPLFVPFSFLTICVVPMAPYCPYAQSEMWLLAAWRYSPHPGLNQHSLDHPSLPYSDGPSFFQEAAYRILENPATSFHCLCSTSLHTHLGTAHHRRR